MASNQAAGNGEQRKSNRKKRVSDKAYDALHAGGQIPGLDFPSESPPPRQTTNPQVHTTPSLSNLKAATAKPTSKMVRNRKKDRPYQPPMPGKDAPPAHAANSFMLAEWPRDRPDNLEDLHSQWYARKDQATTGDIIESYGDDGADDWYEFAGNPSFYPTPEDLEKAIGSTFVNHARRAFRASKTWAQFEADEEYIDSMSVAKREHNPDKYKILMEDCLNNGLRLAVFEKLKERLCADIWHEKYVSKEARQAEQERQASQARKKDSKVSFSVASPEEGQKPREPDEFSVVGWFGNRPIWHEEPEEAANEGEQSMQP